MPSGRQIINIVGQVYGQWTVVGFDSLRAHKSFWKCRCSCGNERAIWGANLKNGQSKSCRCNGGVRKQWAEGKLDRRACTSCGIAKSPKEFPLSKAGMVGQKCCVCDAEYQARRLHRMYAHRLKQRTLNSQAREEAFCHYGRQCACCGETDEVFLAFDHVHGGGSQHRKERTRDGATNLPVWLKKNGFPAGFQVLCNNCNWAKHRNGVCSHQVEGAIAALSFGA